MWSALWEMAFLFYWSWRYRAYNHILQRASLPLPCVGKQRMGSFEYQTLTEKRTTLHLRTQRSEPTSVLFEENRLESKIRCEQWRIYIANISCCEKPKWFKQCNVSYLLPRKEHISNAFGQSCGQELISVMEFGKNGHFHARRVCTQFQFTACCF